MPPETRVDDLVETLHGHRVADPYRWLEDEAAPEVQAWMAAQDAHARAALARPAIRGELAARLRELFYFDAISAPIRRGDRTFYTRKHVDREKTIVYWRRGDGPEQVLFDPNTWSADGSAGLGSWQPSWDGRYVAYARKENNSDEAVLYVRDVDGDRDLADRIAGAKYAMPSWTPDHAGFYYTWIPPVGGDVTVAERPGFAELRYHRLGATDDAIIRERTGDAATFLGGGVSRDGHWLIVHIQHGWRATDLWFRDARAPGAAWTTLVAGVDANADVAIWQDQFYVTTNDGAPRNRVFKVDPRTPERAAWREIVGESDATLQRTAIVGGQLALTYLRNAASEIELRDLDGGAPRTLAIPPLGSSLGLVGNPDDDVAYLDYTSFTAPSVIYQVAVATGALTEWARIELPIDTSELVAEQVWYPSKDGTRVSMFVLSKRGTARDGARPTILYGYGGFNLSMTPGFSSSRAWWLDRGGVYAIPNLRGGGEYGEDWHRAGMLLDKQHTFDDFIAAAEHLIAAGWTSPRHLAISGGSNGGLLVGAALTQRPELFRAVVCAVPLLDMLRYHLYGSGRTWISEYGSAEDPAQFAALYAYSPYRVAVDAGPRAYPAVLFDAADHDDRVDPMHARKLAAVLQARQTGDGEILLRIERNAGHGGADLVASTVERMADQYAFLDDRLR
jgi:prolyl oligopeptidase